MLSFLPVLVHDPDLPPVARAALEMAREAPPGARREAAKRQAAASLRGLFDLTDREIAELLGLPESGNKVSARVC
jgi:DNA-directed RNA polymerase specialized sigma24 family protein